MRTPTLALACLGCAALLAAPGCRLFKRGVAPAAKLPERAVDVKGLQAAGPGPPLSWGAMPGAARYAVTARGERPGDRWIWLGRETSVRFGAADGDVPDDLEPLAAGARTPRQLVTPRTGVVYRWSVSAFDAGGRVIGVSDEAVLRR